MNSLSEGAIRKIDLPEDFQAGKEIRSGLGNNWSRRFHPQANPKVELVFYYRGRPISGSDAKAFREMLRRPPQLVFAASEFMPATPMEESLISTLTNALGNAGNNQISNKEKGLRGPDFFLEAIKVRELNKKHVLQISGYYHNENVLALAYGGIFFESKPEGKDCNIEELFIQAPSKEMLTEYDATFESILSSIQWL